MECYDNWMHRKIKISKKRRNKIKKRTKTNKLCWCHNIKQEHFYDEKGENIIIPKSREESIKLKKSKKYTICHIHNEGRCGHCSKRYWYRKQYNEEVSEKKKYYENYKNNMIVESKIKKKNNLIVEKPKTHICSICCEYFENIKFINCKRGGVQNINYGKYGECCKDKGICESCLDRCRNQCPFCMKHTLENVKSKFSKKKKPFAIRMKKFKNNQRNNSNISRNEISSDSNFRIIIESIFTTIIDDSTFTFRPTNPSVTESITNESISLFRYDPSSITFRPTNPSDTESITNESISLFRYDPLRCDGCGSLNTFVHQSIGSNLEFVTALRCHDCNRERILS